MSTNHLKFPLYISSCMLLINTFSLPIHHTCHFPPHAAQVTFPTWQNLDVFHVMPLVLYFTFCLNRVAYAWPTNLLSLEVIWKVHIA